MAPAPASARDADLPLLVGPLPVGPADVRVDAARYDVAFGEGARMVHVGIEFTVTSPVGGELALAFGARGAWRIEAEVDGAPLAVERPSELALPGGAYDDRVLLRVPLLPGVPAAVRVRVLGDTAGIEREATLTYPQATFLLNQLLEQPRGRAVSFQPGPLLVAAPELRMRVETVSPQRPEAPVTGEAVESAGRAVVEGAVVADLAAPIEVAAVEGEYEAPRNWGIIFGIGAAIDWPRTQRIDRDPATGEVHVDATRCIGCWTCTAFCPYGVIYPSPERKIAIKCDRCRNMGYPICAEVCPTGALSLVERKDYRKKKF